MRWLWYALWLMKAQWPQCPATLSTTGSLAGESLTREGFGCYGACGPSCKAECLHDTLTVALAAKAGCTRCTYRVTTCKSHEWCRWHDDCYRQCDLRWATQHSAAPSRPPSNPCYLACDLPIVRASTLCSADWSQVMASTPSVRDPCWDNSLVVFTTLTHVEPTTECLTADDRARPWATTGSWSPEVSPPSGLPHEGSCAADSDCPDRNQTCDLEAGNYPGMNGWGRCRDAVPPSTGAVAPLPTPGLRLLTDAAPDGARCLLGYDCASGRCEAFTCRARR